MHSVLVAKPEYDTSNLDVSGPDHSEDKGTSVENVRLTLDPVSPSSAIQMDSQGLKELEDFSPLKRSGTDVFSPE